MLVRTDPYITGRFEGKNEFVNNRAAQPCPVYPRLPRDRVTRRGGSSRAAFFICLLQHRPDQAASCRPDRGSVPVSQEPGQEFRRLAPVPDRHHVQGRRPDRFPGGARAIAQYPEIRQGSARNPARRVPRCGRVLGREKVPFRVFYSFE